MYPATTTFKNAISQLSRSLTAKVDIRGTEYGDANIVEMTLDEIVNPGDSFVLGAAPSAKLDLTVIDVDDVVFEGAEVQPEVGIYDTEEAEDTHDTTEASSNPYGDIAQVVKMKQTLILQRVIFKVAADGDYTLNIETEYEASDVYVQQAIIDVGAGNWYEFEIGGAITLEKGASYVFRFERPSSPIYRRSVAYDGVLWQSEGYYYDDIFTSPRTIPFGIAGDMEYREHIPLGTFTVDSLTKTKNKTKLTCFDNMIRLEKPYFSELDYPAKLNDVAQEIADKAGVTLATTLPDTRVPELDGYTLREAIGFVASFMGGFARFNRDGALEIASYTATDTAIIPDNYVTFETGEKPFSIGRLTCYVGPGKEDEEDEGGESEPIILTAGDAGNEISFENPLMTQDQLDAIYAVLSQLSYMPYKLRWQGNPALMAGDIVTITDTAGTMHQTLIMEQQLRYAGGLTATAEAKGKTEQAQEFQTAGPMTRKMERYTTDLANVKILLADKANIGDLSAIDAKIENLVVDTAQIADGAITNAKIKNAEITGAKIKHGEIETAHIQTGAITTALIDTGAIGTAQIADGSITDAKIVGLTANKITAGKIDAADIEVVNLKAANITVGTINGEQISDGAIGSGHIVTGAITNAKIAPGAITGDKIQAGSIKEAAMNWTMHLLF
jgi:hypothetical protein